MRFQVYKHVSILDLSQSWTFAEHYEEAFRPLFLCTKKMEAAHVSLSEFYLEWMIAIQKVKKLQSNPFSAPLVETLTSRLANLRGSRAFKMALYLDPRLNFAGSTLFSSDEKEEIQVSIRYCTLHTPYASKSLNFQFEVSMVTSHHCQCFMKV